METKVFEISAILEIPLSMLVSRNALSELSNLRDKKIDEWEKDYHIVSRVQMIETAMVSPQKSFSIWAMVRVKTEDEKYVECLEYWINGLSNGE